MTDRKEDESQPGAPDGAEGASSTPPETPGPPAQAAERLPPDAADTDGPPPLPLPDGLVAEWQGHLPPGAVPAYLYEDVLRQILRHGQVAGAHAGGLLTGRLRREAGSATPVAVEVEGFAAAGAVGDNTALANRLSAALLGLPDPEEGATEAVGWFHVRTAPGPGPTPQDLQIHRLCFGRPSDLMLLVETGGQRVTLLQVQPRGPVATGFFIVRAR